MIREGRRDVEPIDEDVPAAGRSDDYSREYSH
jgi:hypothetical protein